MVLWAVSKPDPNTTATGTAEISFPLTPLPRERESMGRHIERSSAWDDSESGFRVPPPKERERVRGEEIAYNPSSSDDWNHRLISNLAAASVQRF